MRIISGIHKGRRLTAPKKLPVRPTTDFAKEALFNILRNTYYFDELSVLDLFSGTGNISFEFASRGTENITAVDSDSGCVTYITKITEELEMPISVVKSEVQLYLEKNNGSFDIIFGDPPYDFSIEKLTAITETIFSKNMVKDDGLVILEHASQTDLSSLSNFVEARKYGSSVFSFFANKVESKNN